MAQNLPERKIFIASTTNNRVVARRIQQKINDYPSTSIKFNAKVWDEGDFFTPGQNGLSSLIAGIKEFDYAIIILTPDDELKLEKGKTRKIPRDNLLFELGLSYGLLGEGKVIALTEKVLLPKDLLSDFLGITFIQFDIKDLDSNAGSISTAATKIISTFTKISKNNVTESTYFKQKMIDWRLEREAIKQNEINEGNWTIWLLKEDYYLRYIFGGVLSCLDAGDCYSTISNLDFWASLGVDIDKFLKNNIDALEKGVEINRLILIKKQIFELSVNQYGNDGVQTLIKIIDRFKDIRKRNKKQFNKMKLYFLISDDYKDDMGNSPSPFAIIENKAKDDHAIITPMADIPINQVVMTFKPISEKQDRPNCYVSLSEKFNRLFYDKNRRKDLDQMDEYLNNFRS